MSDAMDRRRFFKDGLGATLKAASDGAQAANRRWIRPPFALAENDFLEACTKCGDCIAACPISVIRPLASKFGERVGRTPALDLSNMGCHLCDDWPCVAACQTSALVMPQNEGNDADAVARPLPKLSKVTISTRHCLPYSGPECGVCQTVCPVEGALVIERTKPRINQDLCVGCAMCAEICIMQPKAILIRPIKPAGDLDGNHVAKAGD